MNIEICPPLKKVSNVSYFHSTSLPSAKKTSKFKSKSTLPSFPKILTATSTESSSKTPAPKVKSTLEKKLNLGTVFSSVRNTSFKFEEALYSESFTSLTRPSEQNLDVSKDKFYSPTSLSKNECSPVKDILLHDEVIPPIIEGTLPSFVTSSLSSYPYLTNPSTTIFESKFTHLKNSRFESTSFAFRDRTLKSVEPQLKTLEVHISSSSYYATPKERKSSSSSSSETSTHDSSLLSPLESILCKKKESSRLSTKSLSTLKTKFDILPSNPPSPHSSHSKEEGNLHHPPSYLKKILGPTKTLDFSSHKIISERTLRSYKTSSSSHLSTLHSKSKDKATKYFKSLSSKTKSTKFSSSTCFSSSTLRARYPTLVRLINGEKPLYISTLVVLIIILLLIYLFLIKLLHLPFD